MLRTALHHAASEGHVGVARQLLKADATILSRRDQQNFSALHLAVLRRKEELAELLLDESSKAGTDSLADLNAVESGSGETLLMSAVRKGLGKVVEKLLARGAMNELGVVKKNRASSEKTAAYPLAYTPPF